MEPRPSPAASDYWYPAYADGRIAVVLRDASKRAWPYAVYCATRYHRDIHVAHELMDDALLRTERYLASSGNSQPTPNRVWYYIVSVLKRLSMQRLRHPEVSPAPSRIWTSSRNIWQGAPPKRRVHTSINSFPG
jgi:hypothetical protein